MVTTVGELAATRALHDLAFSDGPGRRAGSARRPSGVVLCLARAVPGNFAATRQGQRVPNKTSSGALSGEHLPRSRVLDPFAIGLSRRSESARANRKKERTRNVDKSRSARSRQQGGPTREVPAATGRFTTSSARAPVGQTARLYPAQRSAAHVGGLGSPEPPSAPPEQCRHRCWGGQCGHSRGRSHGHLEGHGAGTQRPDQRRERRRAVRREPLLGR